MTAVQAKGFVLAQQPTARVEWGQGGKEDGARCRIVVTTRKGHTRGISWLHQFEAHAWIRAARIIMDRLAEDLRRDPTD